MLYRIGVENNVEGRSLAWSLDYPGCFAYGENSDMALSAMPDAIADYAEWISRRNQGKCWLDIDQIGLYLSESFDVYTIGEDFELAEQGYEVNAWFRTD